MKMQRPDTNATEYLCEYAVDPFEECYCRQVNGKHIPNIARYCMGQYWDCPVYHKRGSFQDNSKKCEVNP